jgi:hypothetical protein
MGSHLPVVRCWYDQGKVLRALAKVAFNLLYKYCPNTAVNKDHFSDIVRLIVGDMAVTSERLAENGFIYPSDVAPIALPSSAHSFRLLHIDGCWHIWSSFFGGRIASYVSFPGHNYEDWRCATISAPLRSPDWTVTTSSLIQQLRRRVEWKQLIHIVPDIKILNSQTEVPVICM